MPKRTAQQVIDEAIKENRPSEYLLYSLALVFVGLGTGAFIYSLMEGRWALSVASAIETGLFYPALSAVRKIRRENQKIRLLELALTNSATSSEASAAIQKIFVDEFRHNSIEVQDVRIKKQGG